MSLQIRGSEQAELGRLGRHPQLTPLVGSPNLCGVRLRRLGRARKPPLVARAVLSLTGGTQPSLSRSAGVGPGSVPRARRRSSRSRRGLH